MTHASGDVPMPETPTPTSRPNHELPAVALPTGLALVRDGRSPVERRALLKVAEEIAAMEPSLVVSLLLWPQTIANWATKDAGVSPQAVYQMLRSPESIRRSRADGGAKQKRLEGLRQKLATRLGVRLRDLNVLLDREPAPKPGTRLADPPADWPPPVPGFADRRVRAPEDPGPTTPPDEQGPKRLL